MSPHILVIDDDASNLELIKLVLEREGGYQVTSSEMVFPDLLEVERLRPDMMILDLKMSTGEDGWVFLERLKAHHSLKAIPVLLCSATFSHLTSQEKEIALLQKPFNIDDLLQYVQQRLSESQTAEKGSVF